MLQPSPHHTKLREIPFTGGGKLLATGSNTHARWEVTVAPQYWESTVVFVTSHHGYHTGGRGASSGSRRAARSQQWVENTLRRKTRALSR